MPEAAHLHLLLFVALLMGSCGHVAYAGTYDVERIRDERPVLTRWANDHSCGCFCFAPKIQSAGESGEQAAGVRLEFVASTLNSTNVTQIAYGIAGNVAAVLLYGTNFVPVKRIETGDGKHSVCLCLLDILKCSPNLALLCFPGLFFQWVFCAAVWVTSMVGDMTLQSPKFHPFAMLGGVIWATGNFTSCDSLFKWQSSVVLIMDADHFSAGNLAAVPVIKSIGLGLGILIWGSSSLMMGWASSRWARLPQVLYRTRSHLVDSAGSAPSYSHRSWFRTFQGAKGQKWYLKAPLECIVGHQKVIFHSAILKPF